MTGLRRYAAAGVALVERDARIFMSYRFRPATMFLAPITSVAVFYYVSRLVRVGALGSSDGYFAYVVIGIVGLDLLTSTLGLAPVGLRQELVAGTFERLVASPFGAVGGIVAMLAFPLLQALVVSAATIGFAALAFGMPIAWPGVLAGGPAALLCGLAMAPLGLLAIAGMLVVKQTLSAVSILITVLSICAGVYFPVALLPGWIEWISKVQPFTPALDLLRHLVIDAPSQVSPWASVAKLVGFAAILFPIAIACLRWALRWSRARGTIAEY
jgi:ABC-2 type transport system permease protein